MRKCLYSDFYEGLLHSLIMVLPLIIGVANELLEGNESLIPVSLMISIAGSFYSTRGDYKNRNFSDVRRIKKETIASLLLLSFSLCVTLFIFVLKINGTLDGLSEPKGIGSILTFCCGDYTFPSLLYMGSVVPYWVELTVAYRNEVPSLKRMKVPSEDNKKITPFNVTSGNVN